MSSHPTSNLLAILAVSKTDSKSLHFPKQVSFLRGLLNSLLVDLFASGVCVRACMCVCVVIYVCFEIGWLQTPDPSALIPRRGRLHSALASLQSNQEPEGVFKMK